MKKKTVHRKAPRKTKQSISYFRIVIIASIVLLVIFSGKIYSAFSKQHVLGASTSILLADKGSDDSTSGSGDSGSGSNTSGSNNSGSNSGSNNSGSGSNSSGSSDSVNSNSGPSNTNATSTNPSVSQDTKVDCIGPDGKHFTTSFHDCQELNQKWGHTTFNFTPFATNNEQDKPEPSVTPEQKDITEQPTSKVEVQTEGNKGELNLHSQGLQIEVKREDNGQLTIHAHQEDGQEVTLKSDALDQINETLKDQEVEVSTGAANTLAITSHDVAAHTTLPISIDSTTNTLAVTTPHGTKDVTVLPDQAVQGILNSNVLSNVLSQSSTTSSGSATTVIGLTTVNDQPVFEVQGVKEKHLFGLFPVGFQKTVTVSAQTGQVISTQENPFNQVLEALSI